MDKEKLLVFGEVPADIHGFEGSDLACESADEFVKAPKIFTQHKIE
jgi:hypothetical protein